MICDVICIYVRIFVKYLNTSVCTTCKNLSGQSRPVALIPPPGSNAPLTPIVFDFSPFPLFFPIHPSQSPRPLLHRNIPHHPLLAQHPHHAPLQPQSPLNLLPRHALPVAQRQRLPQRDRIHEASARVVGARGRARRAGEGALRLRGQARARREDLQGRTGGEWWGAGGLLGLSLLVVVERGGEGGGV